MVYGTGGPRYSRLRLFADQKTGKNLDGFATRGFQISRERNPANSEGNLYCKENFVSSSKLVHLGQIIQL